MFSFFVCCQERDIRWWSSLVWCYFWWQFFFYHYYKLLVLILSCEDPWSSGLSVKPWYCWVSAVQGHSDPSAAAWRHAGHPVSNPKPLPFNSDPLWKYVETVQREFFFFRVFEWWCFSSLFYRSCSCRRCWCWFRSVLRFAGPVCVYMLYVSYEIILLVFMLCGYLSLSTAYSRNLNTHQCVVGCCFSKAQRLGIAYTFRYYYVYVIAFLCNVFIVIGGVDTGGWGGSHE